MTRSHSSDLPQTPDVADSEWGEINEREALDYDAATDTYRAKIDVDAESVPLDVVSAVATVSGTPPLELPALYNDVDSDAFEALSRLTPTEASAVETPIIVTYAGHEVTVHADGVISVRPPSDESTDEL